MNCLRRCRGVRRDKAPVGALRPMTVPLLNVTNHHRPMLQSSLRMPQFVRLASALVAVDAKNFGKINVSVI